MTNKHYWLPMYFADWTGKSMVLPDEDAAAIYQHGTAEPRPEINVNGPPANKLNALYEPARIATPLRYGTPYEFRIRLGDMSGGGPGACRGAAATKRPRRRPSADSSATSRRTPSASTDCRPTATRCSSPMPSSTLKRPMLGYPAVVFTGKYADPITLLKAASDAELTKPPARSGAHSASPIPTWRASRSPSSCRR